MAQCENCGASLRPDAQRCLKCGSIIPEGKAPPPPPIAPQPPSGPAGDRAPGNVNVNVHIDRSDLAGTPPQQQSDWNDDYDDYDSRYDMQAMQPHRGGAILAWALFGWFCCVLIGPIVAWTMANRDLRDMDAGIKDPSGYGLVKAGKIIAIIAFWLQLITIPISIALQISTGGFRY